MEWSLVNDRSRRSSPIEIPQRHNRFSTFSPHCSAEQSQSPDMIFEMSPITSNFPPSNTFSPSSPRNSYDQEPFLYHFPVFSTHKINQTSRLHKTPVRCHEIPLSHQVFTPMKKSNKRQRRTMEHQTDENVPVYPGTQPIIRKPAATKIVGFSPTLSSNCAQRNPRQASPPQECLPSAPQSPIFPWSPWILSSNCQGSGEESPPLEAERNVSRFEDYFLSHAHDPERLRFIGHHQSHPTQI